MDVISLKLLVGVILIFISATADRARSINLVNCSNISPHLSIDIIEPIKYDVHLTIKPYKNIMTGIMNITIHVKRWTRNISLHARGIELTVPNITIKSTNSQENAVNKLLSYAHCKNIEVLTMLFDKFINPGLYLLHLEFIAHLHKNAITLRYPYIWNNVTKKWLLTNLHSPNAIRGLFPCWDQPEIKASFDILINHPKEYSYAVFSNLPIQKQLLVDNNLLTSFHKITSMPTYLLAFAMVDNIVKTSNGINSMWYKPNASAKIKLALEVAQYITLDISITMNLTMSVIQNINHIMLPNSPMKSIGRPGLIIYREQDVTYEKDSDMPGRHIDIIKLIAYETTLQWFDRLVGPHRYSDMWIHKIISFFFSYYIPSKIWEEDRFMELFVVQSLQLALDSDNVLELEPIIYEDRDIGGIDELLYPRLYYKKGAAIIYMLYHLVTPRKFEEAISKYLYTSTTDLWTILEGIYPLKKSNGYTIKEFINTWLTTKYYPELYVLRNFGNKTAVCHAVFRSDEITISPWKIPVTYITQSNLISNYTSNVTWYQWPNDKIITDINPEDFIIVNVEYFGYYRVNYDYKNWYRISTFLQLDNFTQIPVLNRAQLINDVYYFTINGDLHISIFLNIIKYLKWEKDFVAWHPMFNILSYMSTFFKYSDSNLLKTYLLEILNGIIKYDDYEFQYYDDNDMPKALRILAIKWACKLGDKGCQKIATDKLNTYLRNYKTQKIPSVWKDWVFCTGMMLANKTVWDIMLNEAERYKDTESFEYLSCTDEEDIILYYLNYLNQEEHQKQRLFSEFHHRDVLGVIIMNVYSEEQLNEITDFILNNIDFFTLPVMTTIDIILSQRRAQIQKTLNTFKMF